MRTFLKLYMGPDVQTFTNDRYLAKSYAKVDQIGDLSRNGVLQAFLRKFVGCDAPDCGWDYDVGLDIS